MSEPTTFLAKKFASEHDERRFLLIGRARVGQEGATIEYSIHEFQSEREAVRITVPISKIDLDVVDVITITLGAPYAKCLAQKLWIYSVGQIEDCLKKTKAYDPNLDWADWLRIMVACLQTNGNASTSDITKALLECVWA